MKAAQYRTYGGPEVIEILDVPTPSPLSDQVLVEVYAASINPFDYKVRRGYMKEAMPLQFPITIGGNFSGVITQVGEGVANFKVGDEVYGQAYGFGGNSGSMAEFIAAKVDGIARKPQNINYIGAASLPLVGASAIQALEEHINLQKGQKILLHGGAGGIGSIAIQLAKSKGAYVATTVASDDVAFAKSLGADEVINYKTQDFSSMLSDFDAVYDTVGGETTEKSFRVLKKGGILVSMMGEPNVDLAKQYGVTPIGQNTKTNAEQLISLKELVEQGVIKPQVDKIFPFMQTSEAFEYQENNHPRGKVVVNVKEV